VFRITREVAGIGKPAAAPYFTDASVLTPAIGSPPTAIIGPGELALAHQTDEYCLVSRIESRMIRSWCSV
jgi:succinyl-diaminopimelate desuccinylase